MKKIFKRILIATVTIVFTACTGTEIPKPVESPSYKQGVQDGCATAKGEYTKIGDSFNNDKDYKDGWFSGRKNCNPMNAKT